MNIIPLISMFAVSIILCILIFLLEKKHVFLKMLLFFFIFFFIFSIGAFTAEYVPCSFEINTTNQTGNFTVYTYQEVCQSQADTGLRFFNNTIFIVGIFCIYVLLYFIYTVLDYLGKLPKVRGRLGLKKK